MREERVDYCVEKWNKSEQESALVPILDPGRGLTVHRSVHHHRVSSKVSRATTHLRLTLLRGMWWLKRQE
jgi:hypothetical protein